MPDQDRDSVIAQLPPAHAVALRLRLAGHGDDVVATALGVPVESVPTLLEVARNKLARLREMQDEDDRVEEPVVDHWGTDPTGSLVSRSTTSDTRGPAR